MKTLPCVSLLVIVWASVLPAAADRPVPRNPLVRVVTISQDGMNEKPGQAMLEATVAQMDRAASFQPDIVCLPETCNRGEAEPLPGPTTQRIAAWAKQHHSYVICPLHVAIGETKFNSAVLIDRDGKIVGRYDKIRPTESELEKSIRPGAIDPPVFQTDFGTIGIQICFDVNWRDQWRRLREKGAQIIFYPSAFPAARQVRSLAWQQQCFVVSSTKSRAASILDVTGETLATTGKYCRWAGAVIPIGRRVFEVDYHVTKFRAIEKKYGPKVDVQWFHDDDLITLASLDPDLTVEDLIAEFQLTPHPDYIARAGKAQDERRPATPAASASASAKALESKTE